MYSNQDKQYIKKVAKGLGIHAASYKYPFPDSDDPIVGVSVAFRPAITNTNCRMLKVAVSYCAKEDKFKSSTGKFNARHKLIGQNCIDMPLGSLYREHGPEAVTEYLLNVFTV